MAKSVKSKKRRTTNKAGRGETKVPEPEIAPPGRSAFSGWPMIIGWLAMLIFTIHACTHMVAAGDTWVAMACGRHFVNQAKARKTFLPFHVDTVEPFSANSHHAGPTLQEVKAWPVWAKLMVDVSPEEIDLDPEEAKQEVSWIARLLLPKFDIETIRRLHPTGWINQNWLTHVIFYSLVPKSSYADGVSFTSNALVYWKFAIYIVTVVCVYYTGRLLGANPALCAVFSCFAMFAGRSFLDIRPAGFSNMLVAVFLLILVLATYRNVLFIWLIVPVTVFWCNVHGGYIYVFIILAAFIGLNLPTGVHKKNALIASLVGYVLVLMCFAMIIRMSGPRIFAIVFAYAIVAGILHLSRGKFVSLDARGICHTVAAAIVAFIASIVFNPFHLTNLTHTYVISISEHAERWRTINEWKGAFDWDNPVGTANPFLAMFVLILAALALWVATQIIGPRSVDQPRKRKKKAAGEYQWPKIDLAIVIIALLTIYMAIRSRRFIPIAAIAACPVIAMLIDQSIRAISATRNFLDRNRLFVSAMPRDLQLGLTIAGGVAVVLFGTWWGRKFKHIYLDAWPNDPKLSSVFMRMTASDAKPFYAMKFIKDNKLEGNMFNYWTEGGFIAWGQEPDPNTGHTPLQLFMDGRAQAAYNRDTFEAWSDIMGGGQTTQLILQRIYSRRSKMTEEDYKSIGNWMDEQMKDPENNAWVVMMPATVFLDPERKPSYYVINSLEQHPNWRLVFLNNRQKILVDYTTPQGKKLFDGIFTGETKYPDEYHKNLIRSHSWYLDRRWALADMIEGFEYARKAFELNPSLTPIFELSRYSLLPQLKPQVDAFCKAYLDKFDANQNTWSKQDGYRLKTQAARYIADQVFRDRARAAKYDLVLRNIAASKRW